MLYLYIILILFIENVHNLCSPGAKVKSAEFPERESDFEVRPNIFIDKDDLLGKNGKEHVSHTPFTYAAGPFGPSHWNKLYPKCGGKHQSPINIDIPSLKHQVLPKLKWNDGYEKLPTKMTVVNNGHTIVLTSHFEGESPKIQGGALGGKEYTLLQIHFHWSMSDHKGSEHTINKKSFPMEMHVVHYRSDLNASAAVNTDKGIAVVGYIFEIGDKCNDAISTLSTVFDHLKQEQEIPIELPNLFRMETLIDKFEKEYVTYSGSLTTPPCYESVVWLVSPYTITITKKQIEKFRGVSSSSKGFGDNFRLPQPINGRIITFAN